MKEHIIHLPIKEKIKWLTDLKGIATKDLSLAHITQHLTTAQNAVALMPDITENPMAFSTYKSFDTVLLTNGKLTGTKHWVSNLVDGVNSVIIGVKDSSSDNIMLVLVNIKHPNVNIHMPKVVGMEATFSGHLTFDYVPATILFTKTDLRNFEIQKIHSYAFITNHIGIATGIINDIRQQTNRNLIESTILLQQLDLLLSSCNLLWEKNFDMLQENLPSDVFWHKYNTMYGLAKKTLVDSITLMQMIMGSWLFEEGSEKNQRYKDALIYSTHMKNLYFSTKEILF